MADENNVELRFLGRQIQILQADVRELKAAHFRLDGDVASLRSEVARVYVELSGVKAEISEIKTGQAIFERAVDARFDQMGETAATNMQILLAAIGRK